MLKSVNCCDHVCILLLGLAALASHPLVGFMDFSFLCKRDIALSSRTALVVLSVTYTVKKHCIQLSIAFKTKHIKTSFSLLYLFCSEIDRCFLMLAACGPGAAARDG